MNQATESPSVEKEIVSKSLVYSLSLYSRMFFKLLGGVVIAKLLGPTLYGLRSAFDLAIEYESYSDLGVSSALNRQAPYYRGENDLEKADLAISSVFVGKVIYAAVVAVALLFTSWYVWQAGWDITYVDFFLFLGLVIFTQKLKEFYTTKLKIDKNFYLLSRMELIYGISITIIGVPLVYFFGFRGLLLGMFLFDVISVGYILSKERYVPHIKISLSLYWELVKIGFPIMIVFALLFLLRSVDRTLVLAMLSEQALGFYAIAMVATSVIGTIPSAIHGVTVAPIMEKLGRTKDIYRIKMYLTEPTVLLAYLLPFLIAAIYFYIHLPIEYFLTEYLPSIIVIKILTFGVFFEAVAFPSLSISLALNKQVKLIGVMAPVVGLNFALNYTFLRFGWGLSGVAFGTSVAYFVFFCVMLWYTLRQFNVESKEYFEVLALISAPFFYGLLLILALDSLFTTNIHGLWSDILFTSLKAGLFVLLYGPIFLRIRNHSAFVKLVNNLPLVHLIPRQIRVRFFSKA